MSYIYLSYIFLILRVHLIVELCQVLLNDNKAFWLGIPAIFLHKYMYQYNITLPWVFFSLFFLQVSSVVLHLFVCP